MRVALVNTNRMQPPIAPIGLDYIAEALHAAGHEPELLDLCWETDAEAAIARFFQARCFGLIGLTLRNTDDGSYVSPQCFLPGFASMLRAVRAASDAPVVLGGAGFSTLPEQVLEYSGGQAGLWGGGEFGLPALAGRMERGEDWRDLPGMVWRAPDGWRRNAPEREDLATLPRMSRRWVDSPRYFREGGQAGFETKRGCYGCCVYCADPLAKGATVRVRPPAAVADEVEALLEQGVDHLHTCDGELNLPEWHALEVCREFTRRGLGSRVRWYAYCTPAPFSRELAQAMREAGCVGVNFGADNGDDAMLRRLRRPFTGEDIINAAQWSRECGMAVMLDTLLGSPGESRESLERTMEVMHRTAADCIGVSVGVRVYPGTPLAAALAARGTRAGLTGGGSVADPEFYLEPAVAPFIRELLHRLAGGDPRFRFFDPIEPGDGYNYNDNQRLVDAIRAGARGAYWDILRRLG